MTEVLRVLVDDAIALWFALAIGGTVLLVLAWCGARLLSRAGAATRFVIWTSAMAGLVAVAAGRVALPTQTMPTSSEWLLRLAPPEWVRSTGLQAIAAQQSLRSITAVVDAGSGSNGNVRVTTFATPPGASGAGGSGANANPDVNGIVISPTAESELTALSAPWWVLALIAVWLVGACTVALRFVRGTLHVQRLVRAAPRNLDGRHWTLLQELSESMRVHRPVSLRWVDEDQIPVTTGIVHPVILLPRIATSWPEARLRVVLQHELAHIARFDLALATAAQVSLVLCWWHPLAWHAMRMMERERELACDDLVLTSGVPAVDYADELLHVVRALRTPAPAAFAALGMARASQVESRVRAVLNPLVSRRRAHRTLVVAAAVGACALLPVGRLVPVARAAAVRSSATAQSGSGTSATATSAGADLTTARGENAPVRSPSIQPSLQPPVPAAAQTPLPADAADEYNFGGECAPKPGSVSISRSSDDSLQQFYRVDSTGCIRLYLHGSLVLGDADQPQRIEGSAPRLIIEHSDTRVTRRLTVDVSAGALRTTYLRDGKPVSSNESEAWARQMYLTVARDVGLDAKRRVARLLRTGGVSAFLAEIGAMRADDVIGRYFHLALADADVRGDELTKLIAGAEGYASRVDRGAQRRMRTSIDAARGRE